MYSERLPPHDINAEEAVIGSILIDGESFTNVTSFVRPSDFYSEKNRCCYQAVSYTNMTLPTTPYV